MLFAVFMLAHVAGLGICANVRGQACDLIEPGATLHKVASGFNFTEGPTRDLAGNILFTDQPSNRIVKFSLNGDISTFLYPAGRANGMCFDAQGNLIACAEEKNELWSIAPDGKVTVIVSEYAGRPFNGPNDVWVAPNGALYFTDPFYRRAWGRHEHAPQSGEHVYYVSPDRKRVIRVASDLQKPNGITGTPDGKKLFVADIATGRTWAFDIQPDGSLTNKTLFCELGSDGMTIDEEGNLYLTGRGVTIFDKTGRKIGHIEVPEPWTANVSFGGPEHRTLFITASKSLYSIRLRVRGANPAK
ncbi:MAG: SMP-30/gluconolactonase/LRE family protein [Verrucomicrobiae bacterium]|nr:SMP-30/gluconolactonase/LRE family protein [Verrucomicrobiae bacterium]MDW7980131.1 SMP-30/gluconolactonase/LRE family protein [Verrucomicrobiales bacterium]